MTLTLLLVAFALAGVLALRENHSGFRFDSRHVHDHDDPSHHEPHHASDRHHAELHDNEDFVLRVNEALARASPIATPSFDREKFGSEGSFERKLERANNRQAKIDTILQAVQQERLIKKQNIFSYQAVFSRNTSQVCISGATSGVQITFTNTTTTIPFDQSNLTTCAPRTGGPVIIIGKTTSAPVESDSFDGNHNGVDDVQEALNKLAASQTVVQASTTPKAQQELITAFLLAVRNRALVNGGSIGLKSIIVTGRQAIKNNPFAIFGGVQNRILISPCFPVERPHSDPVQTKNGISAYSFEFVGVASGWNGVFGISPALSYSSFVQTAGTNDEGDVLYQQTPSFSLVMGAFPNPNTAVGGTVQPGVVLGSVFFERCTAFSYFA